MSTSQQSGFHDATVVIGLNAALQKRFVLPESGKLVPGSVHRAAYVEEGVGGKGQNVTIALSCLLPSAELNKSQAHLAQFIGRGAEGDKVIALLGSQTGERQALTIRSASGMRTCTTIVGSDCTTELVEPSGVIEAAEMEALLQKVESMGRASDGKGKAFPTAVSALCIMGSMPPGCPIDTYAKLYEHTAGQGTATLIDSVIGLQPLLARMALLGRSCEDQELGRAVLKINASELCKLGGVARTGSEADGVSPSDLYKAAQGFLEKFGPDAAEALDHLAITDGAHPGYLVPLNNGGGEVSRVFQMGVLDLMSKGTSGGSSNGDGGSPVLYPIGAGDTVAAGTLAAWRHFQVLGSTRRQEEEERSPLSPAASEVLAERLDGFLAAMGAESKHAVRDGTLAVAFAFGLACGSASCLKQDNAVFDVEVALRLFMGMAPPTLLVVEGVRA